MNESLLILLGFSMIGSWIYVMVAQFKSIYRNRIGFEQFVTWFAIVTLVIYVFGNISE